MSSPAEGVKDLLILASIGSISPAANGWAVKVGRRTDTPDQQIICFDTGGLPANPKWLVDYPSVQVMVRGAKEGYATAYAKAKAVKDSLLGINPLDLNGDRWSGIIALGDIGTLGYDEQNRPLFSMNFRIFLEPASGTYRSSL